MAFSGSYFQIDGFVLIEIFYEGVRHWDSRLVNLWLMRKFVNLGVDVRSKEYAHFGVHPQF